VSKNRFCHLRRCGGGGAKVLGEKSDRANPRSVKDLCQLFLGKPSHFDIILPTTCLTQGPRIDGFTFWLRFANL
jgi:hypothetical protein